MTRSPPLGLAPQEPCAVAVVTLLDEDVHAAHEDRAAQVRAVGAAARAAGSARPRGCL